MKVLMLINDSIHSPNGGMGVLARNVAENLADVDFKIIGYANEGDPKQSTSANIKWHGIETISNRFGDQSIFSTIIQNQPAYCLSAIDFGKPDLIHAFDYGTSIAAEYLSNYFKVPWIFSIQLSMRELLKSLDIDILQLPHGIDIDSIEQCAVQNCNHLISVSHDYASRFRKINGNSSTINNGINLRNITEYPDNKNLKILYIGRYDRMKNVESLLNVNLPENVELLFAGGTRAGNGSVFDKMIQKCNESTKHHYLGYCYGSEKEDLFDSVDAVIIPSIHEPFGIVGLEAFASNRVLIASSVNGMNDYCSEGNFINCGTTEQTIQSAIASFSEMSFLERKGIASNGYETSKKFDWKVLSKKYLQIYNKIVNE